MMAQIIHKDWDINEEVTGRFKAWTWDKMVFEWLRVAV